MKLIALYLFFVFSFFSSTAQNSQVDPSFFQTWYIFSYSVDLGATNYYYGEDVARMIIHEDLSFYATDNCWEMTGNFEIVEVNDPFEFELIISNYEKDCVLGGSSNYILDLLFEFDDLVSVNLSTGSNEDTLDMETFNGTGPSFKNVPTLTIPTINQKEIVVYPNPTSEILNFQNLPPSIKDVSLFNIQGSLIKNYSVSENQLNISALPAGIYFIKILQDDSTTVKRIVKQ